MMRSLLQKCTVFFMMLIIAFSAAFFILPQEKASASSAHVVDEADLLTDEEEASLDKRITESIDAMHMDLVVVTTADAKGKSSMEYADDYYDYNGYGIGSDKSGALILIDMDNRNIWISTTGAMIEHVSDSDIDSIIDSGYSDLKSGDYYGCLKSCVKSLEKYGRGNYISFAEVLFAAIAAILCGAAACLIVKRSYKYKIAGDVYPYRENSTADFSESSENFINTVVTTRRIESSSGSGGGGSSTHVGGSGMSHGGGGRSF